MTKNIKIKKAIIRALEGEEKEQKNKVNSAQIYLLNNELNDLVLNPNENKPKKWVYTSDIMMKFKKEGKNEKR